VVFDRVQPEDADGAVLDALRHGARSVSRPGAPVPEALRGVVEASVRLDLWQAALRGRLVSRLRVPDDGSAQSLGLAWLLGGRSVEVEGAPWPGVVVAPDARRLAAAAGVRWRYRSAEGRERVWTRVDEGLAPYLDPTFGADALVQVRMYQSNDGDTWRAGPVVAHGLTSLGLTVVGDDAALVVSATAFPTEGLRRVTAGAEVAPVLLLTTGDLERWGLRGMLVDPPLALVDPQVDDREGRWEITAWTHFGAWGADPARLLGARALVRGVSEDGVVFTIESPAALVEGLADPNLSQGLVTATYVSPGQPLAVRRWPLDHPSQSLLEIPGASVPFAWRDGAGERIWMQGPSGEVLEVRESGGAWSAPRRVEGIPDAPRCESPVAARFRGGFVALCSERLREGVMHATHGVAR
jgi:hypothetical protein